MVGAAKPSAPPCADWARVQMPADAGELALVPPIVSRLPPTMTSYPVFGSASRLMSGTPRMTPRLLPPTPDCHDVSGSNSDTPPPPAYHATSRAGPGPRVSVVPP